MFSHHAHGLVNQSEKIIVTDQRKLVVIPFSDLIRVEGDGSYCTIYSRNRAPIVLSKNLGTLVTQLPPKLFYRTHQSHLINVKMVQEIDREDGCCVMLTDGSRLPVARRRKHGLLAILLNSQ